MNDIVNEYFRKFYPEDWDTNYEVTPCVNSYGKEYLGGHLATIFPLMRCKDGFSFSVQGHHGAYSTPRDDFADRYMRVEVWELSEPEPLLAEYGDGSSPLAYVPVELVAHVIEKHGGLVP